MFNWNSLLRGAGFPLQSQQSMMPVSGSNMSQMPFQPQQSFQPQHPFQSQQPFQPQQQPHWAQHQQHGMGMVLGQGWSPVSQQAPAMYLQQGLLPGLVNMPVTPDMGGLGPAPPSQPPPPLPAEPPPPSPSAPKAQPPTPPAPAPSSTVTSQKSDRKGSKWDQPSSAESAAAAGQPRPPQSPAPGQPRPPQSPAPGQPRPPQSPAASENYPSQGPSPGQPRPPQGLPPNQPKPPSDPAPGQVNTHGTAPDQANPGQVNPAPGQVNPGGPTPGQVNPGGPAPGQVNPGGPAPGQVNPGGPAPGQVNPRGPAPGQVNPRGPAPGQANRGPAPGQANTSRGPVPVQPVRPQGRIPGHLNPHQATASSQPTVHSAPTADESAVLEKTAPDLQLIAELEKVKEEEMAFLEQYKQWKKQYDDWRAQNQNHPNKEQFDQYLEQWKTYEQQMEGQKKSIVIKKQNLEDKLSQSSAVSASKAGPAWLGTFTPLSDDKLSQDRSSMSRFDQDGQEGKPGVAALSQSVSVVGHDRSERPPELRAGDSGPQRLDNIGGTGQSMSGRMNQFAESGGNREKAHTVRRDRGLDILEGEQGEEDMNLDEDEESGSGVIESAQRAGGSSWREKQTTDKDSYNQQSLGDWNSWNQGPDNKSHGQWGNEGNNFSGAVAAGSTRGTEWTGQTGSHTGFQEPGSFRERGGVDWNSENSELRSRFGHGGPGVDSDSGFAKSASVKELGLQAEECDSGGFDGEYEDYDDGAARSAEDFQNEGVAFTRRRGQWNRGSANDFHRGRGGDFLRGRGGDFQRGRGGDFQRGMGGDFQMGRGGDFQMGRGGNFQVGRGDDFQMGRGDDFQIDRGEFHVGRGVDLQRGRGGSFSVGRGDFQRGRGGDFIRGRGGVGGDFQRGRGDDYENEFGEGMSSRSLGPESFELEGGPTQGRSERGPAQGRWGFPQQGRRQSLLSIEFSEKMRDKFADFDPTDEDKQVSVDNLDSENVFGDRGQGQGGLRGRGGQGYFGDEDEYGGSGFFPHQGRGVGLADRGGMDRGRGRGGFNGREGFINEYLDRDDQAGLSLGQRGQGATLDRGGMPWRGGLNNSSFTDSQHGQGYQPGRVANRGENENVSQYFNQFGDSDNFQMSDRSGLRDITAAVKGQRVDPGRSAQEGTWEDQPEQDIPDRLHNRPDLEAAGKIGQVSDRGRARVIPDEGEPQVKKGRLSLDEDKDGRRVPPNTGDFYQDRQTCRDYRDPYVRDPYLDPYATRPPFGFDRLPFDRFGVKSTVYDPLLERKPLLPMESIDYGHGGVDKERKVIQPAKVIEYGHGQSSTEGKTLELDLDRDRASRGDLGTDILRGGADMRGGRDGQGLTRISELRDRDSDMRRPDVTERGVNLGARYGMRGDEFAGRDSRLYEGAGSEPGTNSLKGWFGDRGGFDGDQEGDRAPLRERDRFREEDDRYRGHRMAQLGSRDEDWRTSDQGGDKLFGSREGRPTLRETGPVGAVRSRHGYSEKDDEYYMRRDDSRLNDTYGDRSSEYVHDRDDIQGDDGYRGSDTYIAPARDSRYGSSGPDVLSRDDRSLGLDRDRHSRPASPPALATTSLGTSTATPPHKAEIVKVEDLLCSPNRESRPPQIVTIIRGLPGSGKTYVSKLLREKEISCGGAAPRMLCLDDYFMVDVEKEVLDPDTGKKIKKRVLEYEYEQALEEAYRQGLLKSFKKTVDDGFFPFIIVDATNEKVAHFSEFWSYAKSKGFQVYVGELNADIPTCIQRNIHQWTEWDIEKVKKNWEPLPSHYIRLDLRWLLQEDSIPEVVMEDTQEEENEEDKNVEEEEEDSDSKGAYKMSKWELDTSEETLDKLDGIRVSKKHIAEHQSLNDYLQPDQMDDDYFTRESLPGKKRVRWADLEEKKNQSRRRDLGFIVGQTQQDWERITDNEFASKALNQTKYFYKN